MGNNQVVSSVDELAKAEAIASTQRDFMQFAKNPKAWTAASSELKDAQAKIKAGKEAEATIKKLGELEKQVEAKIRKLEGLESKAGAEKDSIKESLADIARREAAIRPLAQEKAQFEDAKKDFETYKETTLATIRNKQSALDKKEQADQNKDKIIKELRAENATLTAKIDAVRGRLE